jgi:translation factor SUA5
METKILKMREEKVDSEGIKEAAEVLREGGLVVFPTETVYGLGANALDGEAVKSVFKAKGRPQDNPLIVHVADYDIHKFAKEVPEIASKLMRKFWPGPLTIILKRRI